MISHHLWLNAGWEGECGQVGWCEIPAESTRLQPHRGGGGGKAGDGGRAGNVVCCTPAGLGTTPSTPGEGEASRRGEG